MNKIWKMRRANQNRIQNHMKWYGKSRSQAKVSANLKNDPHWEHQHTAFFAGERCLTCGINQYDWEGAWPPAENMGRYDLLTVYACSLCALKRALSAEDGWVPYCTGFYADPHPKTPMYATSMTHTEMVMEKYA